jgi:WD40 repeat protein
VRIQERKSGETERRFEGRWGVITPDWRLVLTVHDSDGSVILWRTDTGKQVRRFAAPGLKFGLGGLSPDGRWIVGIAGSNAAIWKSTGKLVRRIPVGDHRRRLADFSPDSRRFLSVSGRDVRLIELATGEEVRRFEGTLARMIHDH